MTQSVITQAALLAQLPDNTSRTITPRRVRDAVVSLAPFQESRNPGVNDDKDNTSGVGGKFDRGQFWLNVAFQTLWVCIDGSTGAAVWAQVGTGGGGGMRFAVCECGMGATIYATPDITFTKNSTGVYQFDFAVAYSDYNIPAWFQIDGTSTAYSAVLGVNSTTQLFCYTYDLSGTATDPVLLMALFPPVY